MRDAASVAGIELLPWDDWAGTDDLTNRRDRLDLYTDDAGATLANARAVLVDHEWIGIPRGVASYHGFGEPAFEEVLLPAA